MVVSIGGREVYRNDKVSTRLQIGLADSWDLDLPPGEVEVTIALPERGLEEKVDVTLEDRLYLGASVASGDIVCRLSKDPFGYV